MVATKLGAGTSSSTQGGQAQVKPLLESAYRSLFKHPLELSPGEHRLHRGLYLGLYLLGLVTWSFFLEFGRFELNFHDWPKEAGYFNVLQQALTTGQLPTHIMPYLLTERFLANPEVPLSPQVLLLNHVGYSSFVLINTLLMYSLGFLGLVALARRVSATAFSFITLFLFFNFNGSLTSHLSVGHSMWVGYFLLPYFLLLVTDLASCETDRAWDAKLGLTLFGMLLVGAFHVVVWCSLLLGILGLTRKSHRKPAIRALVLTGTLGAFRLFPAAIEFASSDRAFVGGFQSTWDLLEGFVALKSPILAVESRVGAPDWWEVDYYVGWIGLLFLAYYGLIYWIRNRDSGPGKALAMLAPALVLLTVFSLDPVLRGISKFPIPLMDTERVSSRLLTLPFLFVVVFAIRGFDDWLHKTTPNSLARSFSAVALFVLALDLWQHTRLWRIGSALEALDPSPQNIAPLIINRFDPVYSSSLWIGAALTVVSLGYSFWALSRRRAETRQLVQ
ncbi:MAG TPA: hypothetical protein VGC99_20150 [Candidatus Tectomicrobia bacterium]